MTSTETGLKRSNKAVRTPISVQLFFISLRQPSRFAKLIRPFARGIQVFVVWFFKRLRETSSRDPSNIPMTRQRKTTAQEISDLNDQNADPFDRASAIIFITRDKLSSTNLTSDQLIDDPSEVVRGEALRRLFFIWKREDLLDRACAMALEDESGYARLEAIDALGMHFKGGIEDPKKKRKVLRTLIACLRNEPERAEQVGAYTAILSILDGNDRFSPGKWNKETDVDWQRLREFE